MPNTRSNQRILRPGVFTSRSFLVFSLFWCWEAVLLYMPSIHTESIGIALLWNISNYCSLFFCILLLLAYRKIQGLIGTPAFRIFSVLLLEAGTLIAIAISFLVQGEISAWQYVLCIAGSIVMSAGILLLDVILVYLLMGYSSNNNRAAIVIGSMAAHLLLYLLIDNLPLSVIRITVLVLPVLVAILLRTKAAKTLPVATNAAANFLPVPLRYLVSFFVLSLSINFIRNAVLSYTGADVLFSNSSVIALTLLLFVLGAALEMVFTSRKNTTISPLIITLFVTFSLFVYQIAPNQKTLMLALTFSGFFLYVTMFYRTAADYAFLHKEKFLLIVVLVFAANMLGLSSGSLLWNVVDIISGSLTPTISLVLAYLIFIAGVVLFFSGQLQNVLPFFSSPKASHNNTALESASSPNPQSTRFPARKNARDDSEEKALTARELPTKVPQKQLSLSEVLVSDCDLLAQGALLTKRENETLYLLARRRNYLQIANELHVSTNTAKSHIRHVYQKLNIHSAEELFQKLEDADKHRILVSNNLP